MSQEKGENKELSGKDNKCRIQGTVIPT